MRTTVILFLAGLMGLYTAATSTAQPQIHFLPDQVQVTGLTPGERAVVFGVASAVCRRGFGLDNINWMEPHSHQNNE